MSTAIWLENWFRARTGLTDLPHDKNMFDAAWIDSMGVMELIDALEQEHGFRFAETHFQDRRFPTIEGLSAIVEEIVSAKAPQLVRPEMSRDWASYYASIQGGATDLRYPSETLVRLLKGDYLDGTYPVLEGRRILDVGFGSGNNLAFLCTLGMEVHGVEIDQGICAQVRAGLEKAGLSADLRTGSNRKLPYADDTFDYLVSWNVLHYEGEEQGIVEGIAEFARVLKPGGRLLLSTTGPEHRIVAKDGKTLGNHRYLIGDKDDFRKGQVHFFFDAPNYLRQYFEPKFSNLQIGRTHDALFTSTLDWWIVTGVKPGA